MGAALRPVNNTHIRIQEIGIFYWRAVTPQWLP
ncbi:MAG: hypothetical protein JWQ61_731, partial [Collimonas fungivorans]|nr:hypothetical protein [Collimonas fungivorans]